HLLTLCETEITAVPDTTTNAIVGEQVLFPVHNQCTALYEATFFIKSPIHTKLASWGFNPFDKRPLYENRLQRSVNDSVKLLNVQITDTKLYQIEINCFDKSKTAAREQLFDLQVFEPVSKPRTKITCSTANVSLSCEVSNGTNVTFHWEKLSLSGAINGTYDGPDLVIDHANEEEQYWYKCIAENPVSNATSDPWTIKECKRKPFKELKILLSISVVLIVLVLIVYFYKIKRTARDKGSNTATQMRNEEISYLQDGTIEATYITRIDSS
ncbi:hepatic and glial cell adhesion molecule-like, partial [Mustelus asterias]